MLQQREIVAPACSSAPAVRSTRSGRLLPLLLLLLPVAASAPVFAQPVGDEPPPAAGSREGRDEPPAVAAPVEYSSPWTAWEAGAWDQALQGFADRQTKRPDDAGLSLNVGAAHYRLNDFEAADGEFFRAASAGDEELRAQALYNLGNSAYRQGRLDQAIDFYRASLEVDPDDIDAKFNLEFVREEMERQKQEQEQSQDGQDRNEQDRQEQEGREQQQSDAADRDGEEQPRDQQGQGEDDRGQDQGSQAGAGPRDTDGDGLDDELERNAANPTDPQNADSDADGLPDGEEDRNRNGRVDPGETDPNLGDSDGDGVPDARDPAPEADGAEGGSSRAGSGEPLPGMTPEEALRYLQALEEGRPDPARRGQRGRRSRHAKDW